MVGEYPQDFETEASGKVIVAPERFNNAQEIIDVCQQMILADRVRIPWRTAIDGLVDGNATYRLSTLRNKGQSWRARANYRGAKGLLQARQTPFYDLVTEVDPCIEICLDYGEGVAKRDWELAIARNWTLMYMKRWRSSFNYHIPLQQLEMLKHGIGCHIWPGNKNCWTPRTPMTGSVLFPDGVSLNIREDLDYFMLRDFLPGYALYEYIQNEETATKLGWNVDSTWKALAQCSKTQYRGQGTNTWNVEMAQREYKSGDIGTTTSRQSGLWLDHLFVKEIETGKITQYTVAEGVAIPGNGNRKSDKWASCLFRKRNKFDEWPIVLFPYDIGSGGLLHTVRGLGAATKDFFELENRITNAMADQVLMGSLLTATQTGDVDPDKLKLMRLGMLNIIPRGLAIQPGVQFPPLAQGPLALLQELKSTMRNNNENYVQGAPEPADRETATSMTMRMQNAGQVGKGAHSLYASNYQQALEKMFRISCKKEAAQGGSISAKLAKEFQDRCLKDGVPQEALSNVYEVKERLSTGAGSAAARLDAMMMMMKFIYPTTTEERKINIERDFVAAAMSGAQVDRYARSQADNSQANEDQSFAVQENNGLMEGGDALASPTQDQVKHLETHLPKAAEVVQLVYAGQMDPAEGLAIIQKFGKHCGEHLKFLQTNPMRKAEFDQLSEEWRALSVIADKLQQQVEMAAQAEPQQSPQEQVDDKLAIGLAGVAAKERIGMANVQSKGRIDLAKVSIDSRIKAAQIKTQQRNGSRPKAAATR